MLVNDVVNIGSVNSTNSHFLLMFVTGILTLKSIFVGKIWISVTAEDGGLPRKSSQATIAFHVCLPDAFKPTFVGRPESFLASVAEDGVVGMVVGQVRAIVSDTEDGGQVVYGISSGNTGAVFAISEQSGVITVTRPLDRETQSRYVLELVGRLAGVQVRETKRNFTIAVTDVNDNSPKFSQSVYEASVLENSSPGTRVVQVDASDDDSGENAIVRYRILGDSSAVSQFVIEEDSGIVRTRARFNYRLSQQYTVVVEASDSLGLTSSLRRSNATVKVQVLTVNQFAPRFTHRSYHFTVGRSVTVGQSVGTITATDQDSGYYGRVEYVLVTSGGSGRTGGYRLNRTSGVLSVWEEDVSSGGVDWTLIALAKNPGPVRWKTSDSCVIVIEGQGSTMKPLLFNQSVYQVTIKEDIAIGSGVLTIWATGGSGEQVVVYSMISGNTNNAFVLDSEAGVMRVQGGLSHLRNPVYNISVAATTSSQSGESR